MIELICSALILLLQFNSYLLFSEKLGTLDSFIFTILYAAIFLRTFAYLFRTKFLPASIRFRSISIGYFYYLIVTSLSVLYFCGELDYLLPVSLRDFAQLIIAIPILITLIRLLSLEKINADVYGKQYRTICIVKNSLWLICFLTSIFFVPTEKTSSDFKVRLVVSLLAVDGLLYLFSQKFKNYWLHRNAFCTELENIILRNQEKLVIEAVEINKDETRFFKELSVVLQTAPNRVLEFTSLLDVAQSYMLNANKSREETIDFVSSFAKIMIVHLMKRKADFKVAKNLFIGISSRLKRRSKKERRAGKSIWWDF